MKVVNTKRKIAPTKLSIKDKFTLFFSKRSSEHDFVTGNPETKSEILYKYIYIDNIEYKQESNLSMTFNKEFKNQLKNI